MVHPVTAAKAFDQQSQAFNITLRNKIKKYNYTIKWKCMPLLSQNLTDNLTTQLINLHAFKKFKSLITLYCLEQLSFHHYFYVM